MLQIVQHSTTLRCSCVKGIRGILYVCQHFVAKYSKNTIFDLGITFLCQTACSADFYKQRYPQTHAAFMCERNVLAIYLLIFFHMCVSSICTVYTYYIFSGHKRLYKKDHNSSKNNTLKIYEKIPIAIVVSLIHIKSEQTRLASSYNVETN